MTHSSIIVTVIILSGVLGGVTNFLTINEFKNPKESWINFFKAISFGLCASITVPLFLQIISNNLLDEPVGAVYPLKNYLIFTGFCVLAAFFSKRFLEDLYEKVNQAQKEAKEAKKSAEEAEKFVVSQLEEEQEENDVSLNNSELITAKELNVDINFGDNLQMDQDYIKLLENLQNSKFRDRSIAGLAKGTKIDQNKLLTILDSFIKHGFLDKVRWYGKDFYRLTNKGKRAKISLSDNI